MGETLVVLQHHGNDATVLAGYECYAPSYMHSYSCRVARQHISEERSGSGFPEASSSRCGGRTSHVTAMHTFLEMNWCGDDTKPYALSRWFMALSKDCKQHDNDCVGTIAAVCSAQHDEDYFMM